MGGPPPPLGEDRMTGTLPSRRDEAWRYSDIDAVAAAWPLPAPESIIVPAGGELSRAIVQDAGAIHQIEMSIGKNAKAALHILNIGGAYGRIELTVTLHEGADFTLGRSEENTTALQSLMRISY